MGGAIGSIAGGLIGAKGSKDAAKEAAKGQEAAAKAAAEQFKPYDVTTPFGTVDVKGRKVTSAFSEQAQGLLDLFTGESTQSVDEAAQGLYDRMQALAQRDEDYARRTTREGLFRSGRLGTSGGIREIGEVEEALARARMNRELAAYDTAWNQRQGAFQNYLAMSGLSSNLLGASINRNPAAAVSAAGFIQSGATRAAGDYAFKNAMYQGLGNAIGSGIDWGIGQIFNTPSTSGAFGSDMYGTMAGGGLYSPF